MNKIGSFFTIIFCILLLTQTAAADDSPSFGGSLGVTYWYPNWSNEQSDFDSSTSGLYGPVVFLYYGNIGVGIQYYTGEFDLDFPGTSSSISADRTDLDFMISYRIADIFQLSVLYKQIQFEWSQTYHVESDISGFGFGGGFNKVFPSKFLIYGFGFYMPGLDYEQDIAQSTTYNGDADGYWFEGGVGYLISDLHLLAKLGYRYQTIDIDAGSSSWKEKTDGVRVDISYYF
ncbi:hypothetical protein K8T06_05540 [bacterium]|nr:hypothetical protein [bacterium]